MSPAEIGAIVGVARDAFVAGAESGLRSELPDGQSSLSDDQIAQVTQTVVDTVNPGSCPAQGNARAPGHRYDHSMHPDGGDRSHG